LRRFVVKVDGQVFEAEVEEMDTEATETKPAINLVPPAPRSAAVASQPAAVVPQPTNTLPASPSLSPVTTMGTSAGISAPMPGSIVKMPVHEGDHVKAMQVLLILEAMKMENEIIAPKDGIVKKVHVTIGQSVNIGDPLIDLETP